MKTFKKLDGSQLFEIVLPFGDGIAGLKSDALHDDCPLCQELERKLRNGEVVEETWDGEEGEH